MTTFINLHRRFRELDNSELLDPESLAALNDYAPSMSMAWPDLLLLRRVVILAEAGSGKTREMREQASRLQAEGKYAFFLPVESLDQSPLVDLLSVQDEGLFNSWKADCEAAAWFFLDAVDELKLTDGKLDRALLLFSKSVDAQLGRAYIILSCRPNDWRPNSDLASFQARLPVPVQSPVMESATSEAIFLDVLASDQHKSSYVPATRNGTETLDSVRLAALLPLSDRQISQYAKCSGIDDSELLLQEIERQNAWTFARRPLDLAEIIGSWISSRCLGTRTQQHEANIDAKLREDPGRSDRGALTDALARVGAERLALALALTRNRSLKSPDQALGIQRAPDVLDPAAVLSDWTEGQRQALMRRALFDPATYGRVRFHHRSVQEYLAARCLWGLRERGMSVKVLFRLLFAERYGIEVVFPSMRPIAAWLAQWDSVVGEELMTREPEVLLSLGDPEGLDIGMRARLVGRFAECYGRGGWRGIRIPVPEIRRLAHPELADAVHEIWDQGLENSDVRELLIELIWQGPIVQCADLAHAAAIDLQESDYCRVRAIQALIACGDDSAVREIAESMLASPDSWSHRILRGIVSDLFPRIINADELIVLLVRDGESDAARDGFGRDLSLIVKKINPLSNEAIALRDQLAGLIWSGRNSDFDSYRIVGKYDYFVDALVELCCRQLEGIRDQVSELLIRACIIASRFKGDQDKSEYVERLRLCFKGQPILRARAFWAELAFMDKAVPAQNDWQRYVHVRLGSLVEPLDGDDHDWLMTALCDVGVPERRAVALHALAYDWRRRGAVVSEVEALRAKLLGDVELEALLDQLIVPVPPDELMSQRARRRDANEKAEAAEEAERLQDWSDWRRTLLADPIAAFTPDQSDRTLSDLCIWLEHLHGRHSRLDVWDREAVAQAFSAEVAGLAENACRALWRVSVPQLWSERPEGERRSTPYRWVSGLYGLSAESESPGWAKCLSSEEARVAATYATIELDRFAPFINDLAVAHPESVEAVIGSELIAEFSMVGEVGSLPVWEHLACADQKLRALLVPPVIASLREWPTTVPDETRLQWDQYLDLVFRTLDGVLVKRDQDIVAAECEKHYRKDPRGASALIWLQRLFHFDAERGVQTFIVMWSRSFGQPEGVGKL